MDPYTIIPKYHIYYGKAHSVCFHHSIILGYSSQLVFPEYALQLVPYCSASRNAAVNQSIFKTENITHWHITAPY